MFLTDVWNDRFLIHLNQQIFDVSQFFFISLKSHQYFFKINHFASLSVCRFSDFFTRLSIVNLFVQCSLMLKGRSNNPFSKSVWAGTETNPNFRWRYSDNFEPDVKHSTFITYLQTFAGMGTSHYALGIPQEWRILETRRFSNILDTIEVCHYRECYFRSTEITQKDANATFTV